ncbi:hypothetical protein BKA69DRAFT_263083 [Paraphysoderma sedebokerense]|nr:hypothetical protein BKA69DRAFT_263083 [Paraphysoderma sedebokerense]
MTSTVYRNTHYTSDTTTSSNSDSLSSRLHSSSTSDSDSSRSDTDSESSDNQATRLSGVGSNQSVEDFEAKPNTVIVGATNERRNNTEVDFDPGLEQLTKRTSQVLGRCNAALSSSSFKPSTSSAAELPQVITNQKHSKQDKISQIRQRHSQSFSLGSNSASKVHSKLSSGPSSRYSSLVKRDVDDTLNSKLYKPASPWTFSRRDEISQVERVKNSDAALILEDLRRRYGLVDSRTTINTIAEMKAGESKSVKGELLTERTVNDTILSSNYERYRPPDYVHDVASTTLVNTREGHGHSLPYSSQIEPSRLEATVLFDEEIEPRMPPVLSPTPTPTPFPMMVPSSPPIKLKASRSVKSSTGKISPIASSASTSQPEMSKAIADDEPLPDNKQDLRTTMVDDFEKSLKSRIDQLVEASIQEKLSASNSFIHSKSDPEVCANRIKHDVVPTVPTEVESRESDQKLTLEDLGVEMPVVQQGYPPLKSEDRAAHRYQSSRPDDSKVGQVSKNKLSSLESIASPHSQVSPQQNTPPTISLPTSQQFEPPPLTQPQPSSSFSSDLPPRLQSLSLLKSSTIKNWMEKDNHRHSRNMQPLSLDQHKTVAINSNVDIRSPENESWMEHEDDLDAIAFSSIKPYAGANLDSFSMDRTVEEQIEQLETR